MSVYTGIYTPAIKCVGQSIDWLKLHQAYLIKRFGFKNGGTYGCRNIAGSDTLSVHAAGRAGDLMTGTGRPTRASLFVAEQMRLFSSEMRLQGVIHNKLQWFCNKPPVWRPFGGSNPHVDHIHYEVSLIAPSYATAERVVWLWQGPAPSGNRLTAGREVSLGVRGVATFHVQDRLIAHGWSLRRDGICGPVTVKAIQQFQVLAGLKMDGIAGPVTQGRLG